MRKILVSVLSLVAFSVLGFAQQEDSFRPHWSLEAQAGAAYTFGEGSFSSMLSPAFSLNFGYHFSEPVEFRLGVGGLSGKGYVASMARYYQYDYVRGQRRSRISARIVCREELCQSASVSVSCFHIQFTHVQPLLLLLKTIIPVTACMSRPYRN